MLCVTAELLPVLFGTGYEAKLDWSFLYVTLHFVVTPFLCLLLVPANLIAFVRRRSRALPLRLLDLTSVAVPIGYLALLYYFPFPFLELVK